MYALLLNWDLSQKPKAIFEQLRQYIADESWKRYIGKKGLVQIIYIRLVAPRLSHVMGINKDKNVTIE